MSNPIIVFGAHGFLGSAVVRSAKRRGHQVLSVTRSGAGPGEISAHQSQALQSAIQTASAVIHAALSLGPDLVDVDNALTASLLSAPLSTTLIYTSAALLYGDRQGQVADVKDALAPPPFMAFRVANEQRVLTAAHARRFVVRAAGLYGNRAGAPAHLAAVGRTLGAVPYLGDGGAVQTYVHVDDVADFYLNVVEATSAAPRLINVSDEQPVRSVDLAAAVAGAIGLPSASITMAQALAAMGPMAELWSASTQVSARSAREVGFRPTRPGILATLAQEGLS